MLEDDLKERLLRHDPNGVPEAIALLLSDNTESKAELIGFILRNNLTEFLDDLINVGVVDEEKSIRAMAIMAVAKLGNRSNATDLLDAISLESDEETLMSMIESFILFAEINDLKIEELEQLLEVLPIERISSLQNATQSRIEMKEKPDPLKISLPLPQDQDEIVDFFVDNSATQKHVGKLEDQIAEAKAKIKLILLDLEPNIPVSIYRLAELSNTTPYSLERYLIELTEDGTLTGEYLELEQMFIKGRQTTSALLGNIPTKGPPLCSDCGSPSRSFPCENCGGGIQCGTCKLLIGKGEDIIECPDCGSKNHRTHLLEWLKIRGVCPICKRKIQIK